MADVPGQVGDGSRPAQAAGLTAADAIKLGARRLTISLVVAALAVLVIVNLVRDLQGFLTMIFMALFLSFAVEPATNWLHAHGWKRGVATGLILLVAFLAFCALFALVIPAIVTGFKQLVAAAPAMLTRLQRWLAQLGVDVSTKKIQDEIQKNSQHIVTSAVSITGGILKVGASIIGGIFRWATIALFLFYFVAEGPKIRRTVCRFLPPERQEQVLFVWEQAIIKTGGYFYSRLLLAAINGTGLYITMRVLGVPFAAPLAIFSGTVSEFIPIVGTYIGGVPPVLVALLFSPRDAIGVIVYLVVYQSIENYLLSPRLTKKTMALHPAVAFAAALIGGALGGFLMAFLALPAAAVIQAASQEYVKGYQVVDTQLTDDTPARPPKHPKEPPSERLHNHGANEGTPATGPPDGEPPAGGAGGKNGPA
jgi:predicted PurR-regulated permease PerM